jgi:hypothetical protein
MPPLVPRIDSQWHKLAAKLCLLGVGYGGSRFEPAADAPKFSSVLEISVLLGCKQRKHIESE